MSRFLVVATVGASSSLLTDGSTILLMSVVRELVDSGHFCYVMVPEDSKMSELPEHKRIMYFPRSTSIRALDSQMWTVDQTYIWEKFSVGEGQYVVDAAICLHPTQVLPLKQALGTVLGLTLPVFCIEQGVSWLTTAPGYSVDSQSEQWGALGAAYANMVVVSEFDKQNWLAKIRAFDLSARQTDRMSQNLRVASAPIDVHGLQSIAQNAGPRYDVPTCLWAARTNATKSPEIVLGIFDALYKQGENLQIKYLTQTSETKLGVVGNRLGLFEERQHMELVVAANREKFYQYASKSHVFVCWSHSESYNSSVVEATLLGCVFLCVDKPQFRQLYPQGLGDPRFWLTSELQAQAAVKWALNNYEEAYALQKPLRDQFIDQQTNHRISQVIPAKLLAEQALVKSPGEFGVPLHTGLGLLIKQIVQGMPEEFTMKDLLSVLSNTATNFVLSNSKRYITRKVPTDWMIHRAICTGLSVEDKCDNRYPAYRKT